MRFFEFHVGRGGRFHNPGHLTFNGMCNGIQYTQAFNYLFEPTQEDGETFDPDLNAEWRDSCGNGVGLTNEQIQSGSGTINIDNDYDTTYTKTVEELTDNEIELVFKEAQRFDGKYVDLYLVPEIMNLPSEECEDIASMGLLAEYYYEGFMRGIPGSRIVK